MLGKLSYVLAPLIVISIFLVSKEKYNRLDTYVSVENNIGMIALNIPGMLYFGLLYALAMINRKKQACHMRYMIATALFVIGPAVGRALELYADVSFEHSVLYSVVVIELLTIVLIVFDLIKKAPYKPYLVTLVFLISFHVTWMFRLANWWQQIGGFIAEQFFI